MNPYESWHEEERSAYIYRTLSRLERDAIKADLFGKLAIEASAQANFWLKEIAAAGQPAPTFVPDLRAHLVCRLTAVFGVKAMRSVLTALKVRGLSVYNDQIATHSPSASSGVEHRHRGLGGGGNLRAAVFGVNDGLVSNACLILGIAGATTGSAQGNATIVLAGAAGLIAGAFAMAAGEYVSVRTQRELYEYQIGLERDELEHYPAAEAAELALIYEAKGIPRDDARVMAARLVAQPGKALDTLAREELGLNPDELGSPWGASISSFCAFALGATIPLLPFVLGGAQAALYWTIGLTASTLFTVGATMSLFTGRSALVSGGRMLVIGAVAGGVTFGIGNLLGVGVP
ncbi:MAG: VIT1/CCC1 transporter family protein [Betaproteobacteria bacterium]